MTVYKQLKDKAVSPERRQLAKTGVLRSAYMLGNGEEVMLAATDLLAETKVAPELSNEAHYYRAKAYLDAGKVEGAMDDLKILAKTLAIYMVQKRNIKWRRFILMPGRRNRLRKKSWIILKSALHILIGWRVALCCCLMFI